MSDTPEIPKSGSNQEPNSNSNQHSTQNSGMNPPLEPSYEELKEQNEKMKRQLMTLLNKYAKLGVEDLAQASHGAHQKRLTDFMQRITRRLDDADLLDVIVEEFLLELGAERVSYVLPDSGISRALVVAHEAVEKNLKRLPLPYLLNSNNDDPFSALINQSLDSGGLVHSDWQAAVKVIPADEFEDELTSEFHAALEEEFQLAKEVECRRAIACPMETTGGLSIICVQRETSDKPWTNQQLELFKDMCRYAGTLLEQTQLTEQIRELKDQLSSLVESMPSAIIGMDLLGTVTMWNGQAEGFFAYTVDEALGQVFWKLVPEYAFLQHAFKDILQVEPGGALDFEHKPFKRKDGALVYHRASLFTMFSNNRGEVALRVDDVSKTIELSHQLLHSQRMETVGTLAGGLAHDFNNVLGGIVGTVSLMRQRLMNKDMNFEEYIEDVEVIEHSTSRASDMVKRLLALSRKTPIHAEPINLNASVTNVVRLSRASFNSRIQVRSHLISQPLWIMGDKTQLEQAILNLCINARDAMKAGGSLYLSTEVIQVDDDFRRRHQGCRVDSLGKLILRDTGEGIPLEYLDKIFDPFFTTKSEQGTGLGLTIVDNVVKQHQGYLEVDSDPSRGTTFTLYFQLTDQMPDVHIIAPAAAPRGEGQILVVDDDEVSRKTAGRILEELGYTVVTAHNGATAIRLFESGIHFDLVVMDVDMPVMNGLDAVRILRNNRNKVRVLFCTGRQHQYEMNDALLVPLTWIINKPFDLPALAAHVKNCIETDIDTGSGK